jgi:hypothetical protein
LSKNFNKGKTIRAHRGAWLLTFGDIPDGIEVLHNCPSGDLPACCNVFAHLWLGTQADNMRDCSQKGRTISHLTTDNIRAIRSFKGLVSRDRLADLYDTNPTTIYDIWTGRHFKHID